VSIDQFGQFGLLSCSSVLRGSSFSRGRIQRYGAQTQLRSGLVHVPRGYCLSYLLLESSQLRSCGPISNGTSSALSQSLFCLARLGQTILLYKKLPWQRILYYPYLPDLRQDLSHGWCKYSVKAIQRQTVVGRGDRDAVFKPFENSISVSSPPRAAFGSGSLNLPAGQGWQAPFPSPSWTGAQTQEYVSF